MTEKILMVDDEPCVLDGYKRLLHKEFPIDTAVGGEAGLLALQERGPFAVVISDMRMPSMNGVQFLSKVSASSPDTVRMVLTGYADIQSAIDAVNEVNIFRFLTKPSEKEALAKAINAALVQYRLIHAEKELLERTLSGSVTVMTEVLSLVNPAAFSRAMRIRRYVQHVVAKLKLAPSWQFEVAAMLSQLGCVTLDSEMIDAVYAGGKLDPEEQVRFNAHPNVARDLLCHIPRLEAVARIIAHQHGAPPALDKSSDTGLIMQGIHILQTTLAYDRLLSAGRVHRAALNDLRSTRPDLQAYVLDALEDFEPEPVHMAMRICTLSELRSGMLLREDVRTATGLLIVAKGQEITYPVMVRLKNFAERNSTASSFSVLAPVSR